MPERGWDTLAVKERTAEDVSKLDVGSTEDQKIRNLIRFYQDHEDEIEKDYFTEERADDLVGGEVIALRKFSGISEGTRGEIVGSWERGSEGYGIMIEWVTENGNKIKDGFSKSEFDRFLELVD